MIKFFRLIRTEIYKAMYSKRFLLVLSAITIALIFIILRQNHILTNYVNKAIETQQHMIADLQYLKDTGATQADIEKKQEEIDRFTAESEDVSRNAYNSFQAVHTVLYSNYASYYILPIAIILIASGSLAMELNSGAAKMWLLRPINRSQVILAKWVASVASVTILLLVTTSIGYLIAGMFFGYDRLQYPAHFIHGVSPAINYSVIEYICINGIYTILAMSLIASISILFSTLTNSPFVVVVGTLICSLIGVSTSSYFHRNEIAVFLPFSHFSFNDHYVINTNYTVTQSVLALITYNVIFLVISCLIFRKKDLYV